MLGEIQSLIRLVWYIQLSCSESWVLTVRSDALLCAYFVPVAETLLYQCCDHCVHFILNFFAADIIHVLVVYDQS